MMSAFEWSGFIIGIFVFAALSFFFGQEQSSKHVNFDIQPCGAHSYYWSFDVWIRCVFLIWGCCRSGDLC